MKKHNLIPRIVLNLQGLLLKAEQDPAVLTYESEIQGLAYAANTKSVLILTSGNGYLGIHEEDIGSLVEELQYIRDEMIRRRT